MATKTTEAAKSAAGLPLGPAAADLEAIIVSRVKLAVDAKVAEIARVTPRTVFNGDDAIFLAYLAGYTAGAHSSNPHDKAALEIFTRSRGILDKLASVNVPGCEAHSPS